MKACEYIDRWVLKTPGVALRFCIVFIPKHHYCTPICLRYLYFTMENRKKILPMIIWFALFAIHSKYIFSDFPFIAFALLLLSVFFISLLSGFFPIFFLQWSRLAIAWLYLDSSLCLIFTSKRKHRTYIEHLRHNRLYGINVCTLDI